MLTHHVALGEPQQVCSPLGWAKQHLSKDALHYSLIDLF